MLIINSGEGDGTFNQRQVTGRFAEGLREAA